MLVLKTNLSSPTPQELLEHSCVIFFFFFDLLLFFVSYPLSYRLELFDHKRPSLYRVHVDRIDGFQDDTVDKRLCISYKVGTPIVQVETRQLLMN